MRYAQLVVGPAGSGKSTYCAAVTRHAESSRRKIDVINLDPAAEFFDYTPAVDIRELINIDDVMEDSALRLGPNGGLVFCMQHLLDNLEWLEEQLGEADDEYYIIDCPGQIELYTHLPIMRKLVEWLQSQNFNICVVFLLDCAFVLDVSKFFSGALATLSAIVNLEAPAVCLDDYSTLKFLPLDITDEESVDDVIVAVDMSIQYGEDSDVRMRFPEEADIEETEGGNGLV